MMQIRFDVGANDGESNLQYAKEGHTIYAFEPTPELIKIIKDKTSHMANYHLYEYAVSNYTGKATFNVAGHCDWGCSSLNEFSDNLDKTWPGRGDFKVSHKIEVQVIKLEDFLDAHPEITHIDFFHCDTQGSDLDVLKGLGKYISLVKEGCIEVSQPGYELYKGTSNDREEAEKWLRLHGFGQIVTTPWANEWNIHFKR
jgi:FkbM family methyltransferase